MYNNKDDDTTTGTTGILGKFRERLNRIRKERMLRKQKNKEEQDKFIKEKVKEIREEVSKTPNDTNPRPHKKVVVKKSKYKKAIYKKEEIKKKKLPQTEQENITNKNENTNKTNPFISKQPINNKPIKAGVTPPPIEQTPNNKETPSKSDNINKNQERPKEEINDKKQNSNNIKPQAKYKKKGVTPPITDKDITNNDKYKEQLKSKIIKRFKKDFSKYIGQLEILEEELHNINDKNSVEIELEKIKELKKEINSIIKKINSIIIEYNIYSSNYELEKITDLNDNLLIDDIIEYKYLLDNYKSNKEVVKEYKLLDEFKKLYQKLDNIKSLSNEVIDNNQEKINELSEKENIHKEVKVDINDVNSIMNNCNDEINNQNKYLAELMSKVNKINQEEVTHYKYKSLTNTFKSTFLFVSSLSLTKKMPLIPRIFINTLATYNMLRNIYSSMIPEKITEIKYSAINYDKEILSKMNDINYTDQLLSDTLSTINIIKSKFLLQYNSQLPGYEDTLHKILSIEDNIIKNQTKVDTIKNKLSKSRKQNSEKILKLENYKKNSQIN